MSDPQGGASGNVDATVESVNSLIDDLLRVTSEVAALSDTLTEMIRNQGETARQYVRQDWLQTNRERFTRMLLGQDDLAVVSNLILSELASLVSAQHAVFYALDGSDAEEPALQLQAGYGCEERKHLSTRFKLGQGLVGQCAKEKRRILLTDVPGDYVRISSGLGEAPPLNIIVLPVLFEGSLRAVIELASFSAFSVTHQAFLDSITESVGIVVNAIQAAALTESLLQQSKSQAEELQAQQRELRQSHDVLGRQVALLAAQHAEAERKRQEVGQSKLVVEMSPPAPCAQTGVAAGVKILVVDDDYRNIFAMSALLEQLHAEVIAAESGAEAIATLQRTAGIDIVLMDITMPVIDGYATMRAIRAMGFESLPIVAMTGKAADGERQRCLDAGANDYVPKPVDAEVIVAALRPWMSPIARPAA